MLKYSNLSTRSHYSCGVGIGTAKEFIEQARVLGLHGFAITDRFTAAGLLDFYFTAKKEKFPVALGSEIYFFDGMNQLNRIILIAKNQNGYYNICKLISESWKNADRFDSPCVSLFDLKENADDLYCISSHIEKAYELKPFYGDNLIFEMILDERHREKNQKILKARERFIISSDAFYPTADHKMLQDIMIINNSRGMSNTPFQDVKPLMSAKDVVQKIVTEHQYLHNGDELKKAFALANAILDECSQIELKFKDQVVNYPHLMHPLNTDGCDKLQLVRRIIQHYGRMKSDPVYLERLEYELDAITNNGRVDLLDYFLVLEDLCRFCRENDIAVGPGRGSGAGSLVNYCLKITNLDPIEYGLLFERFISKGRIQKGTLPDVDLDFSDPEKAREYLRDLYGADRCIRIGTFQTLKVLGSIKDIVKATHPEIDFPTVNKVTTSFGKKDQEETEVEFWERNLEENETAIKFFGQYPDMKEKVEKLIGYNRQQGGHPCGLAITQDSIINFAPLRQKDEEWFLELSAPDCERSGIIKYDVLGLKTLKYIQGCLKLCGIEDLYSIPLNDEKTFKAFVDGDTASVFQFNSDVACSILTQLPLEKMNLDLLCMTTAAGRPGPMKNGIHYTFIKRVQGKERPTPPHEALMEELKETYGLMIYQESVMKASQILGGFSLAEADDIRKAMGKKVASVLVPYRERFISHCHEKFPETREEYMDEHGVKTPSIAEHIWNLMATFSGYGFNKSHSMAYALIGYYCQFLKVNHPLEWWTSCMTHADSEQLKEYYQQCYDHTLNPSVNQSTDVYYIREDGKIQMPLTCLKGLGPKASEEILKLRPFTSFQDFFERVNKQRVNKTVVEKLIFAGCFDEFELNKQVLIDEYFSLRGEKVPDQYKVLVNSKIEEMRSKSLSFLGMDYYKIFPELFPETEMKYFHELTVGGKVSVGGVVKKVTFKKTKNGKDFGDLTIENDGEEQIIRLWDGEIHLYKESLEKGKILKITCNTSEYNSKLQLTAVNIQPLNKG